MNLKKAIFYFFLSFMVYVFFSPDIIILSFIEIRPLITFDSPINNLINSYLADALAFTSILFTYSYLQEINTPKIYLYLLLCLPFLTELFQLLKIINGTADLLDILLYIILFINYHIKHLQMKNFLKHVIGVLTITFFLIGIWGSSSSSYLVSFTPKDSDIFTKASLRDYIKKNSSPTIVLRVPDVTIDVLTKSRLSEGNIYNTIEKELGRAGFIVRDRALFQKVLDEKVSDYSKISTVTNTDLILELVTFEKELYETNKYNQNGEVKVASRVFKFDGIKVEFKLIKVKDNDIVGSYTFHYAPCVNGCEYTPASESGLFSNPKPGTNTGFENISQDVVETFFKDCTQKLIKEIMM